jgi:creatinine amidohydrolase
MTRRLDWAEYRTTEYAAIDPMRTIAILPTAAIEQHGPHLPVGTDTMIAAGMLDRVRALCPDDLDIRILPIQAVGKSNEHIHAPGTLTLSAQTALAAWQEIGLSVARAGVRKIVIVNSHGGNLDLVSILSRELRVRAGMLAVKCQWGAFGHPEGMYPPARTRLRHPRRRRGDLAHARLPARLRRHGRGARNNRSSAETSPIPPDRPDLLRLGVERPQPSGTVGDASRATAEKGEATAAHQAAGFVGLLRKVAASRSTPVADPAGGLRRASPHSARGGRKIAMFRNMNRPRPARRKMRAGLNTLEARCRPKQLRRHLEGRKLPIPGLRGSPCPSGSASWRARTSRRCAARCRSSTCASATISAPRRAASTSSPRWRSTSSTIWRPRRRRRSRFIKVCAARSTKALPGATST